MATCFGFLGFLAFGFQFDARFLDWVKEVRGKDYPWALQDFCQIVG